MADRVSRSALFRSDIIRTASNQNHQMT